MISAEKLAFYLDTFKELSLDDLQALFALVKERSLKAGSVYIDTGALFKRLAYVKSGLIRIYHLDDSGDERTVQLKWEDQFFASFDTMLWQRPSRFIYEAYEDTVLLEAEYQQFMDLVDATPRFSAAKTYFLQHMLAEALERVESFILLKPEARYEQLVAEHPDLLQRIPSKHLASLLGITPVSLSRIRKRLVHRERVMSYEL